jgi:putative ABC transport system permease protein
MLEDWTLRLRSLFKRNAVERELDDELRFHFEQQVASYTRQGLPYEEAVRRTRLALGTVDRIKEEHRDARGVRLVDDLHRDLRFGARQLRRSPGFALAAILCLALGIGATTTIVSVVNTILLQPLPFPHSDRLVRVIENFPSLAPGRRVMQRGIAYQEFLDWQKHSRTLSDAIAVAGMAQRLVRTSQGAAGLWGATISANAFAVLDVKPMFGRVLDAGDTAKPDVVVLAFDTWQRHFNADPNVVGSTLELHAGALMPPAPTRLLTVVGVLPPDFEAPIRSADFYVPLGPPTASSQTLRVTMIGRLASDVSIEAATDELNAMGAAIRPPWPADAAALVGPRFDVQRLKDLAVADLKPGLRIFLVAVVVVLLIVCANVANLLLARGMARQREMSVRVAIGASRGRLVRQILTECLVLAGAGGAIGALLAAAGVSMVKQLATVDAPGIFGLMFGSTILPRAHEVRVDVTVLAIAFGIATVTSVVFGLLPAVVLSSGRQMKTIGSSAQGIGPAATRTRGALVIGQLGMATILLVGAGLLIYSFARLSGNNKGYDATHVAALQLLLPNEYSTARKAETIDAFLTRLRQLSGVRAAGFSRHGVLIGEELTIGTFVPLGRTLDEMRNNPDRPRVRSISAGFLTAMGVPRLDGREFESGDTATALPVIVINRSAARQLFGSARAVGQPVNWYVGSAPVQVTVVGVVEDVRQESLAQERFPEVYVEYHQFLSLLETSPDYRRRQNEWAIGFMSFAIRTADTPEAAMPTIRRLVGSVDPNAGIDALVPMTRLVASSLARQRFSTVMLGVFAGVAAVLAAIGIYGVLAYLVVQRTAEIGLRMALGAQRGQVLALVLRRGLILTIIGITVGLVGAAAVTRFLQGMLFGITPLDARTFLAVALTFGFVTMLASYVPARRATRVDPLVALRSE